MIQKIKELEEKGFRLCIYPQYSHGEWTWSAGVYIGDNKVAIWMPAKDGQPRTAYKEYEDAFNDLVSFCENYKPRKVVIESSKGQGRGRPKTSR